MRWIFILFFITSCATLTKEECTTMNWNQKGFQDSSAGESLVQFNKYAEMCKEHGVVPSKSNYIEGYKRGLTEYCNYQNGMKLGQRGGEPFKECGAVTSNFQRGYRTGFQEYEETQERERRKKIQEEDRKEARQRILNRFNSEECTSDFNCQKETNCTFNKCSHDGSACTFNSECKIRGNCRQESDYVSSINEWVGVQVCHY